MCGCHTSAILEFRDRLWGVRGDEPALVVVQTGLSGHLVRQRGVEAGCHELHDPGGEGMTGADHLLVVGGQLAACQGKTIKEVESDILDNRLLDIQRHEARHLRVGWLLKVLPPVDSLGERLAFAVENEKEWRSASQSCFLGLNDIFSISVHEMRAIGEPNTQNRRVRISLSIWP